MEVQDSIAWFDAVHSDLGGWNAAQGGRGHGHVAGQRLRREQRFELSPLLVDVAAGGEGSLPQDCVEVLFLFGAHGGFIHPSVGIRLAATTCQVRSARAPRKRMIAAKTSTATSIPSTVAVTTSKAMSGRVPGGDGMRTDSVIRPAAVKAKNSPRLMSVASPIVSRADRGSLESAGWLDARMVLTEDLSSVGIRPAPPRRATIRIAIRQVRRHHRILVIPASGGPRNRSSVHDSACAGPGSIRSGRFPICTVAAR